MAGCKCAKRTDEYHGWKCTITDGACMFYIPNSKACAEVFGEGSDVERTVCETCPKFYLEDGKRCCKIGEMERNNPYPIHSKYLKDDVICCERHPNY